MNLMPMSILIQLSFTRCIILDTGLRNRGMQDAVSLVCGELASYNITNWVTYISYNMTGLCDGIAVHIFWNYWAAENMTSQLANIVEIVNSFPSELQVPLYITEFGVLGEGLPPPGDYTTAEPMEDTILSAFQSAWLLVKGLSLGYQGLTKWDAYWSKYDNSSQYYSAVGQPYNGTAKPVFYLLNLFTMALNSNMSLLTEGAALNTSDSSIILAKFKNSADGKYSVIGLDTRGSSHIILNTTSTTDYFVSGIPAFAHYKLYTWNLYGNASEVILYTTLVPDRRSYFTDDGSLEFSLPTTTVFALVGDSPGKSYLLACVISFLAAALVLALGIVCVGFCMRQRRKRRLLDEAYSVENYEKFMQHKFF